MSEYIIYDGYDKCHIKSITISMSYITFLPLTWYEIVL